MLQQLVSSKLEAYAPEMEARAFEDKSFFVHTGFLAWISSLLSTLCLVIRVDKIENSLKRHLFYTIFSVKHPVLKVTGVL